MAMRICDGAIGKSPLQTSTLQCPTDSVQNPVIPLEWHQNGWIPLEQHRNGTRIRHKGLTSSPELTYFTIFDIQRVFLTIYLILSTI